MLRYRVPSCGREAGRTQHVHWTCPEILPKDEDAWREVDRLGILIRINDAPSSSRIRFNSLAEHYLKADFGADAVRPKSDNSTSIMSNISCAIISLPAGVDEIADDINR